MAEIRKMGYTVTVHILGTDEQGRTLVTCPAPTCCGEQPYLDADRFVCPMAERITAYLAEAHKLLTSPTSGSHDVTGHYQVEPHQLTTRYQVEPTTPSPSEAGDV